MTHPSPQVCGLDLAGFEASVVTLVEGPSRFVPELVLHLCAHAAGRLHRDVVFVDGGNSFNPYTLRRIARAQQADTKTVLRRTHVARAFTEYQMNDLLTLQLVPAIRRWEPHMLAVAYLPHLFAESHSKRLLEQAVEHVKELTRSHRLTTVITSYGGAWWGARLIDEWADRVIRVVQRNKLVRIMDEHGVMEFMPVPAGQMRLDAYLEVA